MENFEFITSERGNILILYSGYTFSKKNVLKSSGETFWSCTNKSCNAKLYTICENSIISRKETQHSHESNSNETKSRKKISNSAKRKASIDISERPSKIIHSVLMENVGDLENITTTGISLIRKNIYNARRKLQSKLPKSLEEVFQILKTSNLITIKCENFMPICDEQANIVVFSCDTNLRYLCECQKIYVDGTFQYCTKFFCQLFTIHVINNGHYLPIAFCLLPDKTTTSYITLFRHLQSTCLQLNCGFNPKIVVADFEQAIHNAVSHVFPSSQITGCRFHLGQAWFRKIQNIGLKNEYGDPNSEVGLRHLFGMAYLDPSEVSNCFVFDFAEYQPNTKAITSMADYLVENYISEEAKFPPYLWASCSDSTENTTNACESFHSKFNKYFYSAHPSLFNFIDVLIQLQTDTYIKMNSTVIPKQIQSKAVRTKHELLRLNIDKYRSGEIARIDFVIHIPFL